MLEYLYEKDRRWRKYDNRIDRGTKPWFWKPSVKIRFNTWIDDFTSDRLTLWCDINCVGRYFSPKVWWFMFEYDSDFDPNVASSEASTLWVGVLQ